MKSIMFKYMHPCLISSVWEFFVHVHITSLNNAHLVQSVGIDRCVPCSGGGGNSSPNFFTCFTRPSLST